MRCLSGNARLGFAAAVLLVAGSVTLSRGALGAPPGAADRAKAILAELEAEPSGQELTAASVERARASLARAAAATEPAQRAILADTALEWAEVGRELKRASLAEQASDRLEQEASALQTELARLRAAVEQAMARAGQARHDLAELERRPGGQPARETPRPAPAPAPAPVQP